MKYQKIAIWRVFLPKKRFFHTNRAYPPDCTRDGPTRAAPAWADLTPSPCRLRLPSREPIELGRSPSSFPPRPFALPMNCTHHAAGATLTLRPRHHRMHCCLLLSFASVRGVHAHAAADTKGSPASCPLLGINLAHRIVKFVRVCRFVLVKACMSTGLWNAMRASRRDRVRE
jgi:hypothetical protein